MRLLMRGLWWRRGLAGAVFAVAVVTTTAAALGPLYARSAGESILQDHLIQGGSDSGFRLSTALTDNARSYARLIKTLPPTGSIKGYDHRIDGIYTPLGVTTYYPAAPSGRVNSHLLWRQGECQHLVIVSGHCPTRANEVLVSQRTIDVGIYHWRLGAKLELGVPPADPNSFLNYQVPSVTIVGTYRPRDPVGPFWFGQDYFDQHSGGFDNAGHRRHAVRRARRVPGPAARVPLHRDRLRLSGDAEPDPAQRCPVGEGRGSST